MHENPQMATAKPIEALDVELEQRLHQTRAQALDAVQFHSRELVRHLRVAQGAEEGLDRLNARPNEERLGSILEEAMQEQSQPVPSMRWQSPDQVDHAGAPHPEYPRG